ncbi:MAG: hypothetical protein IPN18_15385 [Ignavibacteriales bacterium]|nr:hypothetical protein [Ignavibacteriales bacterium]
MNNIVMSPSSQIIIKKRFNDLRNEVIEKYLCPTHGVELVLKQKMLPMDFSISISLDAPCGMELIPAATS